MTANNVSPTDPIFHDQAWQTLFELTLPGEAGSEYLAADRVIEAVQKLNWPAAHLERLRLALVGAAQNGLEGNRPGGSKTWLRIRVLIPAGSETPQADRPIARGWGFFLVQKQGDSPPALTGKAHYLIELFLYQEKRRSRKYKSDHLT